MSFNKLFDRILPIEQIDFAAVEIIKLLEPGVLVGFIGPLGAGKSTICKVVIKSLGIDKQVTSPTFTYVNGYGNIFTEVAGCKIAGCNIFHFDLYRINDLRSLYELNLIEILQSYDTISLVEWPQVLFESDVFCNKPVILIKIEHSDQNKEISTERRIIIEKKVDSNNKLLDI